MRDAPYYEFNLSPSGRWNVYQFSGYREGMTQMDVTAPPSLHFRALTTQQSAQQMARQSPHTAPDRHGASEAIFEAEIPCALLPKADCAINIAAVLEEVGGVKSYWALAHGAGDGPDFHDPACFTARLAAPQQP